MATKQHGPRRGHRGRHTKPTKASMSESEPIPSGPTSVHHIPDHLLELVLVRVGSSLALLRAALTCKRWRRIIAADTSFLTRFRSLHGPHLGVLGHYHIVDPSHKRLPPDGNNQVFVPVDGALDRRHFSLDFLPDLDWELGDSRGGLLLLYRRNTLQHYRKRQAVLRFPDMIVCDPLTRRYQGILHWEEMYITLCLGLFLLDGNETGISMSNFRVVVALYGGHVSHDGRGAPYACVFSSGSDGGWQDSAPISGGVVPLPELHLISFAGRARSSLYWRMEGEGAVLALDETTLEFSRVTFPDTVVGMPEESSTFRVIGSDSDDGAETRVVRIINNGDLTVFAQLQGSGEWVVEKLVMLPEVATYGLPAKIVAANTSYILVTPREENWIVSVDLHTPEVERAHERNRYAGAAHPYELQWPPALQACRATAQR